MAKLVDVSGDPRSSAQALARGQEAVSVRAGPHVSARRHSHR